MREGINYIFIYSATFAFILTNLYGWVINGVYKSSRYKEKFNSLFPSNKAFATLYLVQLFEIPYLFMIGEPKGLFYINSFSILIFSSLLVVICGEYFLLKRIKRLYLFLHFLPVCIISAYLLLSAIGAIDVSPFMYQILFWVVCALSIYYMVILVRIQLKIRMRIRHAYEEEYSNRDDFPLAFAKKVEWVPFMCCLLMFICFIANDIYVKMWRDIFFAFVNVIFVFLTLEPQRLGIKYENKVDKNTAKFKLSDERCSELMNKIVETITTENLYLNNHLNIETISQKINTNKNYISEAIGRSPYMSFYNMINNFRIEYSLELLAKDPTLKIEYLAYESGFTSVSAFSQVFKRYKGISPSIYAKKLNQYTDN